MTKITEKIPCRICKTLHDPKYELCYHCSGMAEKAVEMAEGCKAHKNNPQPATCIYCMKAKKEFFRKNKAYN